MRIRCLDDNTYFEPWARRHQEINAWLIDNADWTCWSWLTQNTTEIEIFDEELATMFKLKFGL